MFRSKFILVNVLLSAFCGFSQPSNDACGNAFELCPNTVTSGTNVGATATVCPDCEDDLTFCFFGSSSVWYSFTTNSLGGNVTVDFSNIAFVPGPTLGTQLQAAIFEATVPCAANSFTLVSNCQGGSSGNFQLNATGLSPNTSYIFVVNGAINGTATQPARATFDVQVFGPGADRIPPGIALGGPSGQICPKTQTGFTAYLANCTDTSQFVWSVNGVVTAITDIELWQTSELQDGDVVSVTCNCFSVCPVTLNATHPAISVDNLTVDAGVDQSITLGTTVTLTGTTNGTIYQWSPASEVLSPNNISTIATPSQTTTYFFTGSNVNCSLSDDITVFITDVLEIPGSFSPNGDGANDLWYIPGIEYYPNAQMTIYSRWGQIIAQVTGYSHARAWDGTHNGKSVPDGVYFYELNLYDGNKEDIRKGNVTVIR